MGHKKLQAFFPLFIFCYIRFALCVEESCDFQTSSESENGETLQPPTGCMSGIFTWHNPTDSVNLAFPRSLLPEGSRHRMKVCLRPTIGAGVRDMFQVVGGRGRRGRRPGELRLNTDTTDAAETYPWSCSRPSRRAVRLVLYGEGDEQHEYQGFEYLVEEVENSGKRPNRRPKKTRPDSSRPGPRPGRRPGGRPNRRPGGRRPNDGTTGRNRRPNRRRGGKNRLPVSEEESPVRSFLELEPGNPDVES